ncbi:MAG: amidohydrolase family protein [Saprospiraceae bacterium]
MKYPYLFFILFLSFSLSIDAQRREPLDVTLDWESYDPPSTLVVPEHPTAKAKFPFIDIHSHHWRIGEQNVDELIAKMDAMNMKVVVNLSGRGGERLKAQTDNIKKYGHEDRVVTFTNIEIRSIDEADWAKETLKQMAFDKNHGAKGLKIYKSQGMSNVDSHDNRISINDPRIDPIWEKCGEYGWPVLIHSADPKAFWEPHDSLNERWLELKLRPGRKRENDSPAPWATIIGEMHDIIKRHPGTNFISAHMSWYANDMSKLGELLDDMPNMYVEIGAVIAELGRQPRNANKFFAKYQDRILFGKDSFKPEEFPTYFRVLETDDEYFPYYKRYHAFWKMYGLNLPDEILKKVYYKNALNLLPHLNKSYFPE